MGRNKGWTCTGREVQFLALATRGQEVTASVLEDGARQGLASGGGGWGEDQEGWRASGDPRLLTPDFGMTFFGGGVGVKFSIFVGLVDQRKDASLGLKAELCSFSKSLFFNRYILQVV